MAKIKPEFDKRGVKIIGLSSILSRSIPTGRPTSRRPTALHHPMIGDTDFNVSKLYGMLPATVSGDPAKRTAADNQTVRNVFVIGPDEKIKLNLIYPMTTGRNFAGGRLAPAHGQAQGRDSGELEAWRGRDHSRLGDR